MMRSVLHRAALVWSMFAGIALAQANGFVVSSAADSGSGSLRQVLLDAEANGVADTIAFSISGAGCSGTPAVCTIRLLSPLPAITRGAMRIDGYTQPGAVENTLVLGSNARLAIELDGSLAGASDGLVIATNGAAASGSGSTIRGLIINRFSGSGIRLEGRRCDSNETGCVVSDVGIEGCFIGTDASGNHPEPNGISGVTLGTNAINNVIGDNASTTVPIRANRNIISGNAAYGVLADTGNGDTLYPARGNIVRNNLIGPAANTASPPIGNGLHGIRVSRSSVSLVLRDDIIGYNAIHGVDIESAAGVGLPELTSLLNNAIIGNASDGVHVRGDGLVSIAGGYSVAGTTVGIARNGDAGVYVDGDAKVDVQYVTMVGNGGLGIDIAPPGPNANDDGDGDAGPNDLQNHPVIDSAVFDSGTNTVTATGSINTTPDTHVEIQYYVSTDCDASGQGEGEFAAVDRGDSATTDAQGHASIRSAPIALPSGGRYVTAIARRAGASSGIVVSEFSACREISGASDRIFRNGFDPP
jgi:hypothetical protein